MFTQEEVQAKYRYEDGKVYYRIKPRGRSEIDTSAGNLNKSTGYWHVRLKDKWCRRHRLVFLYHHGYLPKYVDHINGDSQDDRIENLREATMSQNNANSRKRENLHSQYKGVSWHKGHQKWIANIRYNGKLKHLGYYPTQEEAHSRYKEEAVRVFGEFARFK